MQLYLPLVFFFLALGAVSSMEDGGEPLSDEDAGGTGAAVAQQCSRVTFTAVAAGDFHTAALTSEGMIQGWGRNSTTTNLGRNSTTTNLGVPLAPKLPAEGGGAIYVSVSCGTEFTCGLTSAGKIECFGRSDVGQTSPPRNVTFTAVSAGPTHACGLATSGEARCWGKSEHNEAPASKSSSGAGGASYFTSISCGRGHTCALTDVGTLECFGLDDVGQLGPGGTAGRFMQVSCGDEHTCAVDRGGEGFQCWGAINYSRSYIGGANVTHVSSGDTYSCVLLSDGKIECFTSSADLLGSTVAEELAPYCNSKPFLPIGEATTYQPASSVFVAVAAGDSHACGLSSSGSVSCWGDNGDGQAPAGPIVPSEGGGDVFTFSPITASSTTIGGVGDSYMYSGAVSVPGRGRVIFVPRTQDNIGVWDYATGSFSTISIASFIPAGANNYGWQGGAAVEDQVVFAPCRQRNVMVFDAAIDFYEGIRTYDRNIGTGETGCLYNGAVAVGELVVFVPYDGDNVGIWNTADNTLEVISTASVHVTTGSKYHGGAAIGTRVYLAPHDEHGVGIVDLTSRPFSFSTVSTAGVTTANRKYQGAAAVDSRVFFAPASENNVGVYDTSNGSFSTIAISITGASKYDGAVSVAGVSRRVYFAPSDHPAVGVLDVNTNSFSTIPIGMRGGKLWSGATMLDSKIIFGPNHAHYIGFMTACVWATCGDKDGATGSGTTSAAVTDAECGINSVYDSGSRAAMQCVKTTCDAGGKDHGACCRPRSPREPGYLLWEASVGASDDSKPALSHDGKTAFIGSIASTTGKLWAVNVADGSKQILYDAGGGIYSSPALRK